MNNKANILFFVIVMLMIAMVASYGILHAAISDALRGSFHRERTSGHYAAQAGLIWAMERLWNDPTWSAPGGTPVPGGVGGVAVTVTLPDCAVTPCGPRQLTVRASN